MMLSDYFKLKTNVIISGMDSRFDTYLSRWATVADYIKDVCKGQPTITSAHDSAHSVNSMHYQGKGVDIRTRDWQGDIESHSKVISWILGMPWVVVMESTHLHVQVGCVNIKNPSELSHFGEGAWIKSSVVK